MKSQILNLYLNKWQGTYKDINAPWLRWVKDTGFLLPTSEEEKIREHQRAEQEIKQRLLAEEQAKQQAQRAKKLAPKLREMAINSDTL